MPTGAMTPLPLEATTCISWPCAGSGPELPSGMAVLQRGLLPGTLGKDDKEKAPCDTRDIKLS